MTAEAPASAVIADELGVRSRGWRLALAIGPAAIVIALLEIALSAGLTALVVQTQLVDTVRGAGLMAPMVFVVLMILLVPLNAPGLVFVVPSTSLFGVTNGILLSLAGGFIASSIGIVAARRIGRNALRRRLPDWAATWESRLADRGFWAVVVLRTFTFLLQPVDWLCGLSSIPMRTMLAGTFVGLIAPTMAICLSGEGLIELLV